MKNKLWRRLYLAADLLLMLAIAALVPINLYVYRFPEWVMLLAVGLLTVVNGGFVEKFDPRKLYKVLLIIAAVPVVLFSLAGSYCNPYWNSQLVREQSPETLACDQLLTYDQAKNDLDYTMHYLLKCHPFFLERTSHNVQVKYRNALERLQNSHEITVTDLRREVQGILSSIGDAHTTCWGKWSDERYLRTMDARKSAGWHLAAVNGTPVQTLFEENKSLFSYEVESWGLAQLESCLETRNGLFLLGIDPENVKYTWENDRGLTEDEIYTAEDFLLYDDYVAHNLAFSTTEESQQSFVSYTIDDSKGLALLTLKECRYNQEYIDCLRDMFAEARDKDIYSVAVDLRGNGGGSSLVADEFIRYLDVEQFRTGRYKWRFNFVAVPFDQDVIRNRKYDDFTFDGNVYVLTDNDSFSSAMLFAEYIKDNDLGMIIGEAPGNTPNGYGEIAVFYLPESHLYFQVSTKEFFRVDEDTSDKLVVPDVPCESGKALTTLYNTL